VGIHLQHVAEDAQDTVEALVVFRVSSICVDLPRDSSHHFCDNDEVDDQRRSKKRVLAHIEQADGLVSTHEDLCIIFVQSTLVVADGWHVLDNDCVIWVFAFLVEHRVGSDHIVHHVGLGDLFGAELLLGAEVLAIIVAKMVVACNGCQLDAGVDQEVYKSRFHLCLARFEVVTADERAMPLSELDCTRNKSVLRRTIDEGCVFQNACDREDSRRGDLLVSRFDRLEQVVGSIIDSRNDVGIAFGVRSPEDNDFVKGILGFEGASSLLVLSANRPY
jgi:hypothetical protein